VICSAGPMRVPAHTCHDGCMPGTLTPQREQTPDVDLDADVGAEERPESDRPWVTIVWDDPINLMNYVTHVFMTVFDYPKAKAEKLMLDVHQRGKAVVSSGARERMELDVSILHGYGLWATLQQD
jgi:ATP-dependent Clp protease adaptor protein ClpS